VSCWQIVDARRNHSIYAWVKELGGEEKFWNEVAEALSGGGWSGRTARTVAAKYAGPSPHPPNLPTCY
jgi:hypothetical protein